MSPPRRDPHTMRRPQGPISSSSGAISTVCAPGVEPPRGTPPWRIRHTRLPGSGAIEAARVRLLPAVNPMKLPAKALNKPLAALTGAAGQADARPTRQMYAVFEELSAGVGEQVRQLDEVIARELPAPAAAGAQSC